MPSISNVAIADAFITNTTLSPSCIIESSTINTTSINTTDFYLRGNIFIGNHAFSANKLGLLLHILQQSYPELEV